MGLESYLQKSIGEASLQCSCSLEALHKLIRLCPLQTMDPEKTNLLLRQWDLQEVLDPVKFAQELIFKTPEQLEAWFNWCIDEGGVE